MKNFLSLLLMILYVNTMTNCSKEDKQEIQKIKNALITSFELGNYKGKINGTSLLIELPYGADISSLSAKVKLSLKATISPDPTKVKDWSDPVWFTVTAENGDRKRYKVELKILPAVLTFEKLTKKYTKGGHLNATEILKHVKGEKASYTLKEIRDVFPDDIVKVQGSAPNLRLAFNRVGVFRVLLRLKHNATSDLDVTISNAEFEITKGVAPLDLNWIKQSKGYLLAAEISNEELLAGLNGTKTGYRVKTVTISNARGTGVRVSGMGTSAKIVGCTKAGTLTLSIVFEHPTKEDKSITGAEFEITKGAAMPLSWTKQTKAFSSGGQITNANLLAGVTGSGKGGYTIKTVRITDNGGITSARVSGSGRAAKITSYHKAGTLTFTLVLEHPSKADVIITGAQFELTKRSAESLTWLRQSKPYRLGGEISNAELLAGVTGRGKGGYTIKTVRITDNGGIISARVSGSDTAAKITSYHRIGTLTLTLVLKHDAKDDVTIRNAQFEITKATPPRLSWTRQTKAFNSADEITNDDLLAGVTGSGKGGYTIKTVRITDNGGITSARVSGSGRAAKVTSYHKAGTLTLTLVLEHPSKADVIITGAQFELTKGGGERLNWLRQSKPYRSGGEISNADLLAGVTGRGKGGYTIKTVRITDNGGITSARVSGSGRAAKITSYHRTGTLTLTLVLAHDTKDDVTIRNAQFEITKATPPRLSWTRQTKAFSTAGEITNADLLAGVTGSGKEGYTIKTVTITDYGDVSVRVLGSGTAFRITGYTKLGTLTLTLVLEHDAKDDVTLTGAQFEIVRGLAPRLSWTRQTKVFSSAGEITNADLLAGITGRGKGGYTIKTVSITNNGGITSARVSGSGRAAKITSYHKIGTLTLTLVLEHPGKADVTITGAQFELTKSSVESLTWLRQSKPYRSGGEISNTELLAGVTGRGKAGYTIKTVRITNNGGITSARVSGSGRAAKITSYHKIGMLTFTLVLEHPTKADATITGAQFEIIKGSGEILNWLRQSKPYSLGGEISNVDLLAGVTGRGKGGYTIRTVRITNNGGITSVRVSWSGTTAKITHYNKIGTLTLTLVLEHPTKADATITGAQFELTKGSAERLTWLRQSKPYRLGGEISNADLLAGVTGRGKGGYTIKTVRITNNGGITSARVSGSGRAAKITSYHKIGTLTLTLVLEHPNKADATITGAQFELTKGSRESLAWLRQSKPYRSGGEISNADLLAGVTGRGKGGYTIKTVRITNNGGITSVRVSGNGTAAKITHYNKIGTLTFTLVLKHPSKADVTITGAQFELTKGSRESLTWVRQSKPYRSGGEISNSELLAGVTGSGKGGYTIKTVRIINNGGITSVRVSGSGTAAKITSYHKIGTLTLTLVLEHPTKADSTITGAQFELTKGSAERLTWVRQNKPYSLGGEISNSELLAGVTGSGKGGYTIKTVTITDRGITNAHVLGSGRAAKIISYNKAGTFMLTLVLEHPTKADATITSAQFELTKNSAESLVWYRQNKTYSLGGEISNADLLAGVTGSGKGGYTIKTVTITNNGGITSVRVSGSGRAAKITSYHKAGLLTLTLVLEHDTKKDVTLTGAQFEITKRSAERLTWVRQSKPYRSGSEISNANLLAGVTGSGKGGYTIKTVRITNNGGITSARVSGSGRAAKITSYHKAGLLTLTLVLEHDTKKDVTLTGAQFEITKRSAERLTWTKQTKAYGSGGEITNANLLAGVTGSGKGGYTIKTVRITDNGGITSVRVSGSGKVAKIINYNKVGTLTLTIVLEHDTKNDVTITGATFQIYLDIFTITSAGELGLKLNVDKNNLTTVAIPYIINGITVKSIGSSAFYNCNKLTRVTIPNSVTSIGSSAFKFCTILTSITLSSSLTSIGSLAFSHCTSLTNITIPDYVKSIGTQAFSICTSLTTLRIPNSVTSIGDSAFYYCTSLASITLSSSLTSIGDSVFSRCTSLTTVRIPNLVTSIGDSAFYYCTSLTSVTVGQSVTSIGDSVFSHCTSLINVRIPDSVTSIGDSLLSHCTSLTTVRIPDSVTSIGDMTFDGCTSLTNITLSNSVTTIGKWMYRNCSSLVTATLLKPITTVKDEPFTGCSKLTTIAVPIAKVSGWEANLRKGNSASVVGY